MTPKTAHIVSKRPSKGQRTYIRRMKQAARAEGTTYRMQKVHRVPAKTSEE